MCVCVRACMRMRACVCMHDVFAIYDNNISPRLIMIIIKIVILYFIQIRHTDDFPSTVARLVTIYIIIRDCTRVGAFPPAFCVPNSVALASLTLQVVYWAIH